MNIKIEADFRPFRKEYKKMVLLGFSTIKYGGIIIKNVKLNKTEKGMFVSFPSIKNKEDEWEEIVHPITSEAHSAIKKAVIAAFHEEEAGEERQEVEYTDEAAEEGLF